MSGSARDKKIRPVTTLRVEIALKGAPLVVGRLAWRDRVAYLEYDNGFLSTRLALSPCPRLADHFLWDRNPSAMTLLASEGIMPDLVPAAEHGRRI